MRGEGENKIALVEREGVTFFVVFVFDRVDSWMLVSDCSGVSLIAPPVSEEITLDHSHVVFCVQIYT